MYIFSYPFFVFLFVLCHFLHDIFIFLFVTFIDAFIICSSLDKHLEMEAFWFKSSWRSDVCPAGGAVQLLSWCTERCFSSDGVSGLNMHTSVNPPDVRRRFSEEMSLCLWAGHPAETWAGQLHQLLPHQTGPEDHKVPTAAEGTSKAAEHRRRRS